MKNIIETKQLCKTFSNGGQQTHVLKNIDLEIREGDFTVIMGASGAGKSTLLYALSGMDKPTLGEITFCDEEITKKNSDQATSVFFRTGYNSISGVFRIPGLTTDIVFVSSRRC